ncbi:MAG: hypothetical protein QXQ13_03855 [Thermoplasmata archaeon]
MPVERKKIVLTLVTLFAAVYYAARLAVFYASLSGDMEFESEQSAAVEALVVYSFLAIGISGLVMLPGMYKCRPWGFWGTLAVSVYTIGFDLWAFATVQSSAAMGILPAAIISAYLVATRKQFIGGR